jgi:hypothetical protein
LPKIDATSKRLSRTAVRSKVRSDDTSVRETRSQRKRKARRSTMLCFVTAQPVISDEIIP